LSDTTTVYLENLAGLAELIESPPSSGTRKNPGSTGGDRVTQTEREQVFAKE